MVQKSVCILDYGSGNVKSVFNAFKTFTEQVIISNDPKQIQAASHLVLPGVGAFEAAMKNIKAKIPLSVLEQAVFDDKKPFLGICVGMQVLSTTGYEFGEHDGLDWVRGVTKKIDASSLPLPHVGWNNIKLIKESPLTKNIPNNLDFYFVHSFVVEPQDGKFVVATTEYGSKFCSILQRDNIYGVQFHPEKSQKAGLILLKNFLSLD